MANLVASLLDEGTATRSSKQLAEQIDFVGGSLEVRAGEDFTTASARVLKKDVDLGFTLLADILLHPAFPKQEFERVRSQILGEIAQSLGYDLMGIDLWRTRIATATKEQLREEVVVLRWPGS